MAGFVSPRAQVLSDFESTSDWTSYPDTGASVVLSTVPGVDSDALQLNYNLSGGNFVSITNNTVGGLNFTALGANALQFSYRASPLVNTLQIQLADSDGATTGSSDKLTYKQLVLGDNAWHSILVPLSGFSLYPDGNNSFDPASVSHLSFGLTKDDGSAGMGVVSFDDFKLYHLEGPSSLVNSYENFVPDCSSLNSCINERTPPLASGAFDVNRPDWGSSQIVTTQAHTGTHSREIHYTLPSGTAGFVGFSEGVGPSESMVGATAPRTAVLGTDEIVFYAKGLAGGEKLRLQVKSTDLLYPFPTKYLPVELTTSWQRIAVPFGDFKALDSRLDLDSISQIVFLFEPDPVTHLDPGVGRVYIDDVSLSRPSAPAPSFVKTLEDFSGSKIITRYGEYSPTGEATVALSFEKDPSVPGSSADNKVGRLNYSFAVGVSTPYAVVERALGVNFVADPALRFRFKGETSANDIEVKVTDADGTVYRKVLSDVTNTGGVWKSAEIPVDRFSFFTAGADSNLDWRRVSEIELVVARGVAAAGTVAFDLLESVPGVDFSKSGIGRVITRVSTPDNPFSPNGDGVKDLFHLNYNLAQVSRVRWRVFSLQGIPIKTVDDASRPAGDHVIEWDGTDAAGRLVANGLYFYVLDADGADGTDSFKQVVAVIR